MHFDDYRAQLIAVVLGMLTNALNIVTGIAIFGFYASVGCDPGRGGYIMKNDEVLVSKS